MMIMMQKMSMMMKNEHDNEHDDDDDDDDDSTVSFVVFQFSFGSAAIRTGDQLLSRSMMAVKKKVQ